MILVVSLVPSFHERQGIQRSNLDMTWLSDLSSDLLWNSMGVMVRVGAGKARQAGERQTHYVPRGAGNTPHGA